MTSEWPSEEARERYVRFLTLELELMRNASAGTVDTSVLEEFNSLLEEHFPRTRRYIEGRLSSGVPGGLTDEIRAVAWAEARARPDETGQAKVEGAWTEDEIARDMNECFRLARERAGL